MIIVDSRIGSIGFVERLAKYDLQVKVDTLSYGDFAFTGNGSTGQCIIGIERKTIPELIGGFDRLAGHQIPGLIQCYTYVFIVAEGQYRSSNNATVEVMTKYGTWTPYTILYSAFVNRLNTLRIKCGITILHTCDEIHTCHELYALYHWFQKPWDKHNSDQVVHRNIAYTTTGGASTKMKVFTSFPGLGGTRAIAAMRHFKSIREMINAPIDEWLKIEGIGRKTAEKIIKELD
jgi:ERCC4-type nuclease